MAAAGAAYAVYAMYAATALAVAGTAYSAYTANQSAKAQSRQSEENAKQAESQGRVEAERIRELGKKQSSAAQAQMAANGLDLNADNTVVDVIQDDITKNSSKDAWTTFFNSKNQSNQFKTDAQNFNGQGKNALISGGLNMASTALSAYGSTPKNTGTTSISSSNLSTMDTSRYKMNATGWA